MPLEKKVLPEGIFKRGKIFWIRYTDPTTGKQIRESVKDLSKNINGRNFLDAQAKLGERLGLARRGALNIEAEKINPTVESVLKDYLNTPKSLARSSIKDDIGRSKGILAFFKPETKIKSITKEDIFNFQKFLQEQKNRYGEPLSVATVNRYIELFRTACWANKSLKEVWNPFVSEHFLEENNLRNRIVSKQEFQAIMNYLKPRKNKQLEVAIHFGYYLGMRLGEIIQINKNMVNREKKAIYLSASMTKTGEERIIPVDDDDLKMLDQLNADEKGNYFVSRTSTILSKGFTSIVRTMAKRKLLENSNLHFHDLRHTAATNMINKGINIFVIQKICGWKTMDMVNRYYGQNLEEKQKALAKIKE